MSMRYEKQVLRDKLKMAIPLAHLSHTALAILVFASPSLDARHSGSSSVNNYRNERSFGNLNEDYYAGRTLTISTILMEPYAMVRCINSSVNPAPDDLYEGFMVDLIGRVTELAGFRYRLVPVADGQFGFHQKNGSWNGMIGELLRREVDIAAANMYVTLRRRRVVDFTESFLSVGASVLMNRQHKDRLSSLSLFDLASSDVPLKFGTLNRGLIFKSLRKSNDTILSQVFASMKANAAVSFTRSNEEGINRVRASQNPLYAYILPDVIGDYVARRQPCDLIVADEIPTGDHFAFAVPPGSALLPKLNNALSKMKQSGEIGRLYQKWWVDRNECYSQGRYLPVRSGLPLPYNNAVDTVTFSLLLTTICVIAANQLL